MTKILIRNRRLKKQGNSFYFSVPPYFISDSKEILPEQEYDIIVVPKDQERLLWGLYPQPDQLAT